MAVTVTVTVTVGTLLLQLWLGLMFSDIYHKRYVAASCSYGGLRCSYAASTFRLRCSSVAATLGYVPATFRLRCSCVAATTLLLRLRCSYGGDGDVEGADGASDIAVGMAVAGDSPLTMCVCVLCVCVCV